MGRAHKKKDQNGVKLGFSDGQGFVVSITTWSLERKPLLRKRAMGVIGMGPEHQASLWNA
jgi:hypothetical protein